MKLTCTNCGYAWEYGGQMQQATCPSCARKVRILEQLGKR